MNTSVQPVVPGVATAPWSSVHEIVGPPHDRTAAMALYAEGAVLGPAQPTGSGMRHELRVPAMTRASFGTYFNAFPAAYWCASAEVRAVRLRVVVDAAAMLSVHGSDADGTVRGLAAAMLQPFEAAAFEIPLDGFDEGGMVWFDLHAGATDAAIVEGAWEVAGPVRHDGGLVLGMTTMDRPGFVAANLRRLIESPALLGHVAEFVVVDQGERPVDVDPELAALVRRAGRVRVVRQANLGGSGGFSRVMAEACSAAGTAFVTLLDDDIALEPASLLRAFEFGRRASRPTIVGGQMLDLTNPAVLHAGAEVVDRGRFWWGSAAAEHDRPDLGATPLKSTPWLHRRVDADYAGWWMCQIPIPVVERLGFALPMFLKWDDAEYGLRAAEVGVPTVSLPGAAVWHVSWAEKDDMLEWPAYFHARNRLIAALLHGGSGVVGASRLLDLKQLLSMQYSTVALRHRAIEAVLAGPQGFDAVLPDAAAVRRLVAGAADLERHAIETAPQAPDAPVSRLAPATQPTGAQFALWTAVTVLRHVRTAPAVQPLAARLSAGRRRWWVLPAQSAVLAPTADGTAFFRYERDHRRFRAGLLESLRLHARLARRWPALAAEWRAAARDLASPAAWSGRFTA